MSSTLQFLLSLDPLQALVRMANDANGTNYRLDGFSSSEPTAIAGTTTKVTLTGVQKGPNDDQWVDGSFDLIYERLDLSVWLKTTVSNYHPILPISTQNILDEISTLNGQTFYIDDIVLEEVTRDNGVQYALKAKPESLRFTGQILLPLLQLTYVGTLFDPNALINLDDIVPVRFGPNVSLPYLNATDYRVIADGFAAGDLAQNKTNLVTMFNAVVPDPSSFDDTSLAPWHVSTTPGPFNLYNARVVGYGDGTGLNTAIPTLEKALIVALDGSYCTNFVSGNLTIPYTLDDFSTDGYTVEPRLFMNSATSLSDGSEWNVYLNSFHAGDVIDTFQVTPPVMMDGPFQWLAIGGLPRPGNLEGASVVYNGQVRPTDVPAASTGLDRVMVVAMSENNGVWEGQYPFFYQSPIVLNLGTLTGVVGSAYFHDLTPSKGAGPFTFAVTSGSLPSGVDLDTAAPALTGTPDTLGTYLFDLTVTDVNGVAVVFNVTFKVTDKIAALYISGSLPNATQHAPYSQLLDISGGLAPYSDPVMVSGNAPNTILLEVLHNTIHVHGQWNTADTYHFAIGVTSADGQSTSKSFVLSVASDGTSPLTAAGTAPDGTVGTTYSYQYQIAGGIPPYTVSAINMDPGLTVDNTGKVAGTPLNGGAVTWTIHVVDSVGQVVDLVDQIAIAYPQLWLGGNFTSNSAKVGTASNQTVAIHGGNGVYSNPRVTGGTIPPGLALSVSGTNLVLSGNPTLAGTYNFTASVDSGDGQTAPVTSVITVAPTWATLTLTGSFSGPCSAGIAYSSALIISGGNGVYSNPRVISGSLPTGLSVSVSGSQLVISGTPTSVGTFNVTVAVDSGDGQTASASGTITSTNTWPVLTLSGNFAAGNVSTVYNNSLTIAGGNGSYNSPTVASGSLPPGLSLSVSGSQLLLGGTPTTAGTYNFTASVKSGDGQTATTAIQSIVISPYQSFYNTVRSYNPLAYWLLNDASAPTAVDQMNVLPATYGASGLNYGAPIMAPGVPYKGVSTSGVQNVAQTAATNLVNTTSFSAVALVRPTLTAPAMVFSLGDRTVFGNQGLSLQINTNGSLQFNWWSSGYSGGNAYVSAASAAGLLQQNTPALVGLSVSTVGTTTTANIFINGVLVATYTSSNQAYVAPANSYPFLIGALKESAQDNFFAGEIGQVAIWNSALTANQHNVLAITAGLVQVGNNSFTQSFYQAGGNGVFAYEFDANSLVGTTLYDVSGNGYNATVSGTLTPTDAGDPSRGGKGVVATNGSQFLSMPEAAQVKGNGARTLIAVVYLTASSFVITNNEQCIYMGGGDNGGNNRLAFGLATAGSAAAPLLWIDYAYAANAVSLPLQYLNTWVTIMVDHTPGVGQTISIAKQGDAAFTQLGSFTNFPNLATDNSNYTGNWIFQWNSIRRFTGQSAFIAMKDMVLTAADRLLFLPTWQLAKLSGTLTTVGTSGTAYSSTLAVSGGNGTYSNLTIAGGTLPPGLTASLSGSTVTVSGTPTTSGNYNFQVQVQTGDGQTAISNQSIAVGVAAPSALAYSIYNKLVMWLVWDPSQTKPVDKHVNNIAFSATNVATGAALAPGLSPSGVFTAPQNSGCTTTNPAVSSTFLNITGPSSMMAWLSVAATQTGTYPKIAWQHAGDDYHGWATMSMSMFGAPGGNPPAGSVIGSPSYGVTGKNSAGTVTSGGLSSGNAMVPGKTYMLVGTNDASNYNFYSQGNLDKTVPVTNVSTISGAGQNFTLGFAGNTPQDMLNANLLPVAVFNGVLTAAEVSYLWNNGTGVDYAALKIAAQSYATLTGTFTAGTVGVAYNSTLTAGGGVGGITGVTNPSGTLPPGLALSLSGTTVTLSGTPTSVGTYTFQVAITTADGQTAVSNQTVTISPYASDPTALSIYNKLMAGGAYWDLHETTGNRLDSVGTSYLAPSGAATGNGPRGAGDVAAAFSGSGYLGRTLSGGTDVLNVPNGGGTHCLFGWVYLTSTAGIQFLGAENAGAGGSSTFGYAISLQSGSLYGQNGGSAYANASMSPPATGAWHFVRMWRDPADGKVRLQFDSGTVAVSSTASNPSLTSGGTFTLGGSTMSSAAIMGRISRWGWMNGNMLTQAENDWLMNSGLGRDFLEIKGKAQGTWAPLTLTGTLANGTAGVAYSSSLAIGGSGAYVSAGNPGGGLPAGLSVSVSGNTLVVSGTPSAAGTYNFQVSVTTADGATTTSNQAITIAAGAAAPFVYDTFTGAAGQLINHTGETGGWLNYQGWYANYDPTVMVLDGAGNISAAGNQSTAVSNVVAPQMDFYAEMVVNTGNIPTNGSQTGLTLYEHQDTSTLGAQFIRGPQLYFKSASTTIYEPDYMTSTGSGNSNIVLPTPMPSNHAFTLRVEYRYSTASIKIYIDGTMVFELDSSTGYIMNGPPTKPGNFAFDVDSFSSPSGNGITISSVKLGTL